MPSKPAERQASAWLIAERARCRLDGLTYAKELFLRYPFQEAFNRLEVRQADMGAIIKNPQPGGQPGD